MNKETISLAEAAELLGMSKQGVRELMKRKIIDIGVVFRAFRQAKQTGT